MNKPLLFFLISYFSVISFVTVVITLIDKTNAKKNRRRVPEKTLMFVANSCEEGLGNLKGCRQIFKDYGDKIEYLYSFDSNPGGVTNKSVGSHRYKVTAVTEGGHSFGAFGNRNAISVLAEIINEIYKIEVPKLGDSRTTYNVGIIRTSSPAAGTGSSLKKSLRRKNLPPPPPKCQPRTSPPI